VAMSTEALPMTTAPFLKSFTCAHRLELGTQVANGAPRSTAPRGCHHRPSGCPGTPLVARMLVHLVLLRRRAARHGLAVPMCSLLRQSCASCSPRRWPWCRLHPRAA
jgi:hypothetical protein